MSCLGRAGCAVVLVALGAGAVVAWQQRDRIGELLGRTPKAEQVVRTGRPSEAALRSARDKVDSLNGWRADSVVLTPAEAASLVADAMADTRIGTLDSMEIELGDDRVTLRGVMDTEWLPRKLLGPLDDMIGDRQPVLLRGPLRFRRAGRAGWQVDRVKVGDLTLPTAILHRFLEAALPGAKSAGLPVHLPDGVGGLAVRPGALVLYGTPTGNPGTGGATS
ncbi:MAG TPA: hypothetical protein VLA95_01630 [Gemmatimonadales bacterium]|nr:hypothetical protein [Gemmatimonadales bacterium]